MLDLYQYDEEAGKRLLKSNPIVCSYFSAGETVFVDDHSFRRSSYCVRPPGATEACSRVPASVLRPRDGSEWKCSVEMKGCEGWKKRDSDGFCGEDPGRHEGTCLRIPTSCGWVSTDAARLMTRGVRPPRPGKPAARQGSCEFPFPGSGKARTPSSRYRPVPNGKPPTNQHKEREARVDDYGWGGDHVRPFLRLRRAVQLLAEGKGKTRDRL